MDFFGQNSLFYLVGVVVVGGSWEGWGFGGASKGGRLVRGWRIGNRAAVP